MKKLLIIAMVFLLSFSTYGDFSEVTADSILDNQNKLKYVESQLYETQNAINQINYQASQVSQEAKKIDQLVLETETDIQLIEAKIAEAEGKLSELSYEKSVLANNLAEAQEQFAVATEHLTGPSGDYIDYIIMSDTPEVMNNRIEQLNIAYATYESAVAKYEADKVYNQSKEGTVLLERQQLEKDKEIVLSKREFVQEQLTKKTEILGQLEQEKNNHIEANNELEQASVELVSIIDTMQKEAVRTASYTVVREKQGADDKLHWPSDASNRVTSQYGTRTHPISGEVHKHTGTDIGAASGTGVLAAENGVVIHSGWINGYGNTIIIDHGDDLSTLYAHNSRLTAKSGDKVKRGEKVAEVGSTGNSTGPHIHFEVRINGKAVDALPYLQ